MRDNTAWADEMNVRNVIQKTDLYEAHTDLPLGHFWRLIDDTIVRVVICPSDHKTEKNLWQLGDGDTGATGGSTGPVDSITIDSEPNDPIDLTNFAPSATYTTDTAQSALPPSGLISTSAILFNSVIGERLSSNTAGCTGIDNFALEAWVNPQTPTLYKDIVLCDGPIVYYRLEEASTSIDAFDETGNGYTGTYNGPTGKADIANNHVGLDQAADFDDVPTTDYLIIPDLGGTTFTSAMTIEFWLKNSNIGLF